MTWTLPPRARGVWVKLPAVEVVEVLANAGADFLVIDCEHGAIDLRAMTAMVAVARGLGVPVFVRVAACSPEQTQPALDAGASGLFVPHVDDRHAAQHVVDVCRFPPLGRRHASPTTRFGDWGRAGVADLVGRDNDGVMLVAQIETSRAVENIDDILGVEGLDAVFIGPVDLALSSGHAATDPEFRSMVAAVERSARGRRILGGVATSDAGAQELLGNDYSFAMVGADTSLLASATRALTAGSAS